MIFPTEDNFPLPYEQRISIIIMLVYFVHQFSTDRSWEHCPVQSMTCKSGFSWVLFGVLWRKLGSCHKRILQIHPKFSIWFSRGWTQTVYGHLHSTDLPWRRVFWLSCGEKRKRPSSEQFVFSIGEHTWRIISWFGYVVSQAWLVNPLRIGLVLF